MTAVMREKQMTHSLAKSLPIPIHQQLSVSNVAEWVILKDHVVLRNLL